MLLSWLGPYYVVVLCLLFGSCRLEPIIVISRVCIEATWVVLEIRVPTSGPHNLLAPS